MERTARIATGESVAFEYELAGLGSRFIALLIDMAIQLFAALVVILLVAWIAVAVPHAPGPMRTDAIGKIAHALLVSIVVFAIFMLVSGYFIVCEWRFGGRTPGKRLMGIRVVRDGGFPLDFTASVIRNVVRIIEASIGFYVISAISTLLSPYNRRLGDYAAGTLVVRDGRFERRTLPAYAERSEDPLIAELTPSERELIRSFVERRASLAAASRDAIAARIAQSVRPKLAASFAHLSDDDLLVHLASSAL